MTIDVTIELSPAQKHFLAVANGDIPDAMRQLDDALDEGFCLMHRRAYYKLSSAKTKFLGRDAYAEKIQAEWDALTAREQKAIEKNPNGLGKFGMFDSVSKEEVPLALTIAAKLLSSEFKMEAHAKKLLADPEVVARVIERFPILTPQDIQDALSFDM